MRDTSIYSLLAKTSWGTNNARFAGGTWQPPQQASDVAFTEILCSDQASEPYASFNLLGLDVECSDADATWACRQYPLIHAVVSNPMKFDEGMFAQAEQEHCVMLTEVITHTAKEVLRPGHISGLLSHHRNAGRARSLRMLMPSVTPSEHTSEPWRCLRVCPAGGADDTDLGGLWMTRPMRQGELLPCPELSVMLSVSRAVRLCRRGLEPASFQCTQPEGSNRSVSSCFTASLTGLRWQEQTRLGEAQCGRAAKACV